MVNVLVIVCLLEIGLRLLIGNALPPRFFEPSEKFGHFNPAGHEFTAQAIADYLTAQGWVECGE